MALIRWEPARELQTIQQEMNRLFGTFFDSPVAVGANGETARRWIPAMDLVEHENDYVLHADLPGVEEKDIEIEFDENVLTISGERRSRRDEVIEGAAGSGESD